MPWSIRWRIAGLVALYAILAALWIYLSDSAVALMAPTPAHLTQLQTVKGWAFVGITAIMLGLILRHEARARAAREDALRDSEETYRTLVEVESDALFLIDDATDKILTANPAAAALYGYPPAEFLGLRSTDLSAEPAETARITPGTPPAPDGIVRIPRRSHRKRDGTVFPVEITGRFFTWHDRPVHLVAVRDITDRQQAEATLARYRLLAEQARDIVLFVRRDGRILEANQAAVQAYGYAAAEFGTLHIQDLRAPETQGLTAGQLAQADTEGLLFETVHRRKDGTTFPVEVSSRGADLDGDRILLSIIRDITDRQRTAHALATRSRQLEAVQAITAEITRELDLETVLALIHRRAIALVGGTGGSLYLWDEGAQMLIPHVWDGIPDAVGTLAVRRGEGLAGTVAAQRTGMLVNDYRAFPAAHPRFLAETAIVAALAEPLLYHERLVGVIVLSSDHAWADLRGRGTGAPGARRPARRHRHRKRPPLPRRARPPRAIGGPPRDDRGSHARTGSHAAASPAHRPGRGARGRLVGHCLPLGAGAGAGRPRSLARARGLPGDHPARPGPGHRGDGRPNPSGALRERLPDVPLRQSGEPPPHGRDSLDGRAAPLPGRAHRRPHPEP